MISYKIPLVFIWFPVFALGQNLVPNPSFECGEDPCYPTAYILDDYSIFACEWDAANTATPDVLSALNEPECWTSMPNDPHDHDSYSHIGSQTPRTGNRFAGVITHTYRLPHEDIVWREYLQTKLDKTLIKGEIYCAELYASRAKNPMYACNNIGIHFSENRVYQNSFNRIPLTPQIWEPTIITDSINWVRIGGTFIAAEDFNYMVIGNFHSEEDTELQLIHEYNSKRQAVAYYFIDDVSVEKMPYDQFTIAGKVEICLGDVAEINAIVGTDHVEWTTLADTSTVVAIGPSADLSPHITTAYRVKAKGCNKTVIDTITIKVNPLPVVELGIDSTICAGSSVKLDAGSDGVTYRWQDNSDKRYLTVADSGLYSVVVVDARNCRNRDERYIALADVPEVFLGNDTVICSGRFPGLVAGANDWQYTWSTGTQDAAFTPSASGIYWVDVRNQCGTTRDSIVIYSLEEIFLPNIVTVNNDEKDDKLILGQGIGALHIYNRWGKEIFFSPVYKNDWPSDTDTPAGTYYYALYYPGCPPRKSWVQVARE